MKMSLNQRRAQLAGILRQKSEEYLKRKRQMKQAEQDYVAIKSAINELSNIHDPFKSAKNNIANFGWCPTCSSVLIMKDNRKYCLTCNKEVLSPSKQLVKKVHDTITSDDNKKLQVQTELRFNNAKTGDRRLDDLLLGGIPFGQNILIYGPPFTGKEILMNTFVAEGLKKDIPVIWILTNKLPSEVRDEMKFVLENYEEYEQRGLVKYIDAYSKIIGIDDTENNVVYVNSLEDKTFLKTIWKIISEFDNFEYYRLVFSTITPLIDNNNVNITTTCNFLQLLCAKIKKDKSVAFYGIEKAVHDDKDIQMIGSIMDGMFDFKLEQLKTFLSVKGISDVQTRAWLGYTYSRKGLKIGSFSLDHLEED